MNAAAPGRRKSEPSPRLQAARALRIETRTSARAKWKNPPVRIEGWECIACDACMRECPPQFGAIFNDGIDVEVIPELCSGCNRCIAVCPVDCIYPDRDWQATGDLWRYALGGTDPYTNVRDYDLE